jgi:hypothetical protein
MALPPICAECEDRISCSGIDVDVRMRFSWFCLSRIDTVTTEDARIHCGVPWLSAIFKQGRSIFEYAAITECLVGIVFGQ